MTTTGGKADHHIAWITGLRGVASCLAISTHLARAFDPDLFHPASRDGAPARLLQQPFLRVLVQGRLGVLIFFFITGYVCSMQPTRLHREPELALSLMARSALRRTPRLVFPVTIITCVVWIMTQLGMFLVAQKSDSPFIVRTSPDRMLSLCAALRSLVDNTVASWTTGDNVYDRHQWTLLPLLAGSMRVYMFLLATSKIHPHYRMLASVLIFSYYYICADVNGTQLIWGVFLCQVRYHPPAARLLAHRPSLFKCLSVVLMLAGFFAASFPEKQWHRKPWSKYQHAILVTVLPKKAHLPYFSSAIGLELITLSIFFNDVFQTLLCNQYLVWLGNQSFAVYLIHGPLMRSLLCWMVYGVRLPGQVDSQADETGESAKAVLHYPGHLRTALALLIWMPANFGLAALWTRHVDPWCARAAETLISRCRPGPPCIDDNA
ncbi:Acyltransferase 3 [Metarhizium album ARSEF 1941]|uniref:Acyltransferase 3 n=1 Tax=Metarhizium album (strain ARSEF 1941) TaxID=1081103 RepID=A0A0B2WP86_METAS|nr:Acyltransferase 3 [Metarhizium album ARSEF 1941]KHN95823.1 Acyltransferase 3 [Metarhizium album ARSEF 1941]